MSICYLRSISIVLFLFLSITDASAGEEEANPIASLEKMGVEVQNGHRADIYKSGTNIDKAINAIRSIDAIDGLRFTSIHFNEKDGSALRTLDKLCEIEFRDVDISSSILTELSKLPNLKELSLINCRLTPETARIIGNCSHLRCLYIDSCKKMNGTDYGFLSKLRGLQELTISNMDPITPKPTDENGLFLFDDVKANALRGNASIKYLCLYNTSITDKIFDVLDTMPQLENAQLSESNVTQSAVDEYRTKRPQVDIVY